MATEPDRPRIYSRQVRQMAEQLGIDLDAVEGSGPRGGVTLADVQHARREQGDAAEGDAMTALTEPDGGDAGAANGDGRDDGGQPPAERAELWERWANELTGYGNRLTDAGAEMLGGIVHAHAMRVRDVGERRLPRSAAAPPAAIDAAMVGRTLASGGARRRVERALEVVRNILIFVPVLVAWTHIAREGLDDLGDLRGTALIVAGFIVALIVAHVALGMMRQQREARAERIARDFATALAATAMALPPAGDDAESAIAAFAQAGAELSGNLRGAGQSLTEARAVLERMARTVEAQGQQVDRMLRLLEPIARIGDQMGGVQGELRDVTARLGETMQALGDIRQHLAPTAGNLAETAGKLEALTGQMDATGQQLGRMSDVFGSRFEPLDHAAANFEQAVKDLNAVMARVLRELDGSGPRG